MSPRARASERRIELIGHRGARGLAPENTLEGFACAVAVGIDAIELDVGMSRDGEVIVHHDIGLNPDTTRDASGRWVESATPLRSLSARALARYRVGEIRPGSEYAQRFPLQRPSPDARIPTLIETFEWCAERHLDRLRLVIEAKVDPQHALDTPDPCAIARAIVERVRRHGLAARAVVQSFDWRVQRAVRTLDPTIATAHLSSQREHFDTVGGARPQPSPWLAGLDPGDVGGSVPRLVVSAGGAIWSPDHRDLSRERLAEAQDLGLRVVVWTVNEPSDIERALDLGVDGIITDYPDRVRAALAARGLGVPPPAP